MPKPIWKGHLVFGLVTIPVSLYTAERAEATIDFDLLDSRDRQRVRYKRVNERTGREVPWGQIVRGVKHDDEYIILEKEDFEQAAADVSKGLEIVEFIERESIAPEFFEKPYYLAPDKGGEKGYWLLREAMQRSGRAGVAKLVLRTRERLAALIAEDEALMLVTMRFADEVRRPEDLELPATKPKLQTRELQMAERLIEGMASLWEPSRFHDTYREALQRVIAERVKHGRRPPARPALPATPTGDVMELLRRSVESASHPASRHRRSRPAHSRRHPRRKRVRK